MAILKNLTSIILFTSTTEDLASGDIVHILDRFWTPWHRLYNAKWRMSTAYPSYVSHKWNEKIEIFDDFPDVIVQRLTDPT